MEMNQKKGRDFLTLYLKGPEDPLAPCKLSNSLGCSPGMKAVVKGCALNNTTKQNTSIEEKEVQHESK